MVGGFKHVEHVPFHKKGMSSFPLTLPPSFFKMVKTTKQDGIHVEIQQLMDIVGDVATTYWDLTNHKKKKHGFFVGNSWLE